MDRLNISTRLNLLIAGLLTLLITVAASGLIGLTQADEALRNVAPMASVAEIQERLLRNRLAVAVALVTPDDATITHSVAEIEQNIGAIDGVWKNYLARPMGDEQRRLTQQFAEHRKVFVTEGLLPVVAALKARQIQLANRLVVEALRPRYAAVGTDIKALLDHLVQFASEEHTAALDRYARIRVLCIGLCVGAAVIAVVLGRLLTRSITAAIGSAMKVAEAVAEGDLSMKVPMEGKNEITRLLFSLERMRCGLPSLLVSGGTPKEWPRPVRRSRPAIPIFPAGPKNRQPHSNRPRLPWPSWIRP